MTQDQFDQLLAWTMLSALNSSVLEHQRILGRDLTEDEYKDCHKQAHQNAELIRQKLKKDREKP